MANRFAKYGDPAPAPDAPATNRFAKYAAAPEPAPQQGPPMPDADTLRRNRLTAIARAALPPSYNPVDEVYKDSFTLGLQGPTAGLGYAVGGSIKNLFGAGDDSTFGERYSAGERAYDENLAELKEKAGGEGTVASIAGMLTPGAAGQTIRALPTAARATPRGVVPWIADKAGKIARGPTATAALDAAQLSAVQSAGQSRGSLAERVEQIAEDTLKGAAIGGALSKVLGVLPFSARRAARRADRADARGPTPHAIRDEGRQLYDVLDNSGTAFDPNQAATLASDLGSRLRNANIRVADMPIAENVMLHQGPLQLQDLQRFRTQASDLSRSSDSRERRMAAEMLGAIDDFVGRQQPALTTLAPGELEATWRQARQYWRTAGLAADLGWTVDKAVRRAETANSGGNIDNAIRQNVRGVYDRITKPGAYNPYARDQATMHNMESIMDPGPFQDALRYAGNKFGGTGPLAGSEANWLSGGAGALTALATRDPAMVAGVTGATKGVLWAGGKAAKQASNRMTENAADELIGNVARGGAPRLTAAQQAIMNGPPTRERLALIQAMERSRRLSSAAALGATDQ